MSTTYETKHWERIADGVWKNADFGTLFERPKILGRWTFRSLQTKSVKLDKEELAKKWNVPAIVEERGSSTFVVGNKCSEGLARNGSAGLRQPLRAVSQANRRGGDDRGGQTTGASSIYKH